MQSRDPRTLSLPVALATLVLALASGAARSTAQSAGSLDSSFGSSGLAAIDFAHSTDIAHSVAIQPDGKLVVVGATYTNNDFSTEDFAVVRLLPDGSLDPTFGAGGKVTTDFPGLAAVASSVVIQPDGKILVAGGAFPEFTFLGDFELVRYDPDGSLDTTFGAGGIVTTSFPGQGSFASSLALQPDGKIVAAGTDFVNFSTSESSNTDFALARYLANGALDATFGAGGKVTTDFLGFNDDAFALLVRPDGRLVAVGSAKNAATFYDFAAARYMANGAIDTSFGTGGKVRTDFGAANLDQAFSACLQPDGKLVAAGTTVGAFGSTQRFAVARYALNGALDASFDGDGTLQIDFGSFGQSAKEVLLQPDGKLIAVGSADTEGSDADFLLARCNPDGSLDAGFGTGGKVRSSFGQLNDGCDGAALQPDGRIVAVGFEATATANMAEIAVARYLGDAGRSPFVDLGSGLAGSAGIPSLTGAGSLVAGTPGSLTLSAAAPSAAALLFVSASSTPAPFKCGTLVPVPVLAQFFLPTNAAGTVALSWTAFPGGLSGSSLFLQFAIQDAAATCGTALSNALRADVP